MEEKRTNGEEPSSSSSSPKRQSNSREQRNKAEKQRRDRMNCSISILANMLPMVKNSGKRMDKTNILRLTAHFIRFHQVLEKFGCMSNPTIHPLFEKMDISALLTKMSSFMLIVLSTGKIVMVSPQIETLLGYNDVELAGQSLYNIILPDDREILTQNLHPDKDTFSRLFSALTATGEDSNSSDTTSSSSTSTSSSSGGAPNRNNPNKNKRKSPNSNNNNNGAEGASTSTAGTSSDDPENDPIEQRRSFYLRIMQKSVNKSEMIHYEPAHLQGFLRIPRNLQHKLPQQKARQRRSRVKTPLESDTASQPPGAEDIVLVGICRVFKPMTISELSLLITRNDEYLSRHNMQGTILYMDHRISIVAGYMPEEVAGTSGFDFMHKDDSVYALVALRHMFDQGVGYGSSYYRLRSVTGEYIYMKTQGFLEYNKSTDSIETFICFNTLLTEKEGKKNMQDMQAYYSAKVRTSTPETLLKLPGSNQSFAIQPTTIYNVLKKKAQEELEEEEITIMDDNDPTQPQLERPSVITKTIKRRPTSTKRTISESSHSDVSLSPMVSPKRTSSCSNTMQPATSTTGYAYAQQVADVANIQLSQTSTTSPSNASSTSPMAHTVTTPQQVIIIDDNDMYPSMIQLEDEPTQHLFHSFQPVIHDVPYVDRDPRRSTTSTLTPDQFQDLRLRIEHQYQAQEVHSELGSLPNSENLQLVLTTRPGRPNENAKPTKN